MAIGETTARGMFLAPYVPSPLPIVQRMLEVAGVGPGDTVYDLGSGDGRIVIAAAQRFGARAVGVELDDGRCAFAAARIRDLGLATRAQIVHGDLATADLTPATVVTLYQLPGVNEALRPALERQLRPGARVVTHDFPVDGWSASKVVTTRLDGGSQHTVFLYEFGNPSKESTMSNGQPNYSGIRAALELGGVGAGGLRTFEGGSAYAQVADEPIDVDNIVRKHVGAPKYEDIAISFGSDMSATLYDWIQTTLAGKAPRKDGSVVISDFNYNERSRLYFYNALITEIGFPACDGAAKTLSYFTLKITPEYTRTQPSSGKASSTYGLSQAKKLLASNYVLSIDGITDTHVSAVDPLVVKLPTTAVTDANGQYVLSPGAAEIPNLAINTTEQSTDDWRDWFDNFVIKGGGSVGSAGKKGGTLKYMAPGMNAALCTLTFSGLGILRFAPTKFDAGSSDKIRKVRVEMFCEELAFAVTSAASASTSSSAPPATDTSSAGASTPGSATYVPELVPSLASTAADKLRFGSLVASSATPVVAPRLGRPLRFRS